MNNLDEILKGCRKCKRDAQSKLYKLYSSKLFFVCLYYSKDQTEAEDILHDGFLKIFNKIGQYKGKGSFEGWMKRIMINTALEKFRKQNQLHPVNDVYEYIEDVSYEDVISQISFNDLLKYVQQLSPKYRMVFNLYGIEGYSHKEISKEMGISIGTSKSNLSRARNILQEKVKKELVSDKKKMVV
ncbi:MAG: sigma-70 family RNA polymerase sigma factor [Bacteroidota bacterium]|nr:sigma-70 family RNA polymerase sigma factor [Bacteroidota bacterium]